MVTTDIWHQLNLHRKKRIIFFFAAILFTVGPALAQKAPREINLPNYDERWLHYGFVIGLHSSNYGLRYNEVFTSELMDSVHSIQPPGSFGFSLGLLANFRLAQYLDFRFVPKVSFYENRLEYYFTDRSGETKLVESTVVEFPMLLKFKSQRRKNSRMYLIAGISPGIDATGKKDDENDNEKLLIKSGTFAVDFGFGVDMYYPLFKFSPELRYSMGVMNSLKPEVNPYSLGIERLTIHSVTLYLQFE